MPGESAGSGLSDEGLEPHRSEKAPPMALPGEVLPPPPGERFLGRRELFPNNPHSWLRVHVGTEDLTEKGCGAPC